MQRWVLYLHTVFAAMRLLPEGRGMACGGAGLHVHTGLPCIRTACAPVAPYTHARLVHAAKHDATLHHAV